MEVQVDMAFNNNWTFQDSPYVHSTNTENLYHFTSLYNQVSPGCSSSSDSQSSSISTNVMSPDTTMQDENQEDLNNGLPFLEITEEPADEFRFRYQSEMHGAHGAILGKSANKFTKKYPTVKLHNFNEKAIIRCSLATVGSPPTVHAHRLVAKLQDKDGEKDDPHDILVGTESYEAEFRNMVIIHIEKKKLVDVLHQKIKKLIEHRFPHTKIKIAAEKEAQIKQQAKEQAAKMDMNQVSLKFEALICNDKNQLVDLCKPVYTVPINNLKSHLRGKLKICRIDKHIGSCRGGEEVFIFVEKVAKQNIRVQFFELDEDKKEIWHDYAVFGENDVHHQYGIVFRTPPYRTPDIKTNAHVFVRLERPSDGSFSEPLKFQYKPDYEGIASKKRKLSSDLPIAGEMFSQNNQFECIQSPSRSPDTTDVSPEILNDDFLMNLITDMEEHLGLLPFPDDDLILNEQQSIQDGSLPSHPSLTEFLDKLPSPVSEEVQRGLQNLITSDDFEDYKKYVPESSLGLSMIVTDGVVKEKTGVTGNNRLKQKTSFTKLKENITREGGLKILNKILLSKKRGLLNNDKFTDLLRTFFTIPLDSRCNRAMHLALLKGTNGNLILSQYIDFLLQPGMKQYLEKKSEFLGLFNIQNSDMQTPLHIAVMKGLSGSVSKLINTNLVDPNISDNENKTPLHHAILSAKRYGDDGVKIIQSIIESPLCDINSLSDDGTALHMAIREENIPILDILLRHPLINVNSEGGSTRDTVLHIAVKSLNVLIVKHLMFLCNKFGKNLEKDKMNSESQTPITLCALLYNVNDKEKEKKITEILNALLQTEEPRDDTSDDENMKPIKELLSNCLKNQTNPHLKDPQYMESEEEDTSDEEDVKPNKECLDRVILNKTQQKNSKHLEPMASNSGPKKSLVPIVDIKTEEDETILGYNEETGVFDRQALKDLKAILDEGEAWKRLCFLLGYRTLIPTFEKHESPTLMLLTYAETYKEKGSEILYEIYEHLITLALMDGVKVMYDLMHRKNTKENVICIE